MAFRSGRLDCRHSAFAPVSTCPDMRPIAAWQISLFVAVSYPNTRSGTRGPDWGDRFMRMETRLLRFASLLPASLLLGMGAGAGAQETHAHVDVSAQAVPASAVKRGLWSDPASWPDGKVPAK